MTGELYVGIVKQAGDMICLKCVWLANFTVIIDLQLITTVNFFLYFVHLCKKEGKDQESTQSIYTLFTLCLLGNFSWFFVVC